MMQDKLRQKSVDVMAQEFYELKISKSNDEYLKLKQ
jgi:hypothetical protein